MRHLLSTELDRFEGIIECWKQGYPVSTDNLCFALEVTDQLPELLLAIDRPRVQLAVDSIELLRIELLGEVNVRNLSGKEPGVRNARG